MGEIQKITDITTSNLDQGTADFARNKGRLKFEVMSYNPFEVKPKKPSFLSRIFSFAGGFSPLAIAAAPFTGGLSLIAGAALAGAGGVGAKAKQNSLIEQQQAAAASGPQTMAYPGFAPTASGSDPMIDLVSTTRSDAIQNSMRSIK